ncbi:MAG TPA: MFS transporter, partial [bacterium]|nr:MFS transporter [bacterium]
MAHGELRIQEAATDAATAQAIELGAAAPRGLFHSFRYRDFALFWTGACLSNVGTWMQMVAQSALIYALSGSTVTLGVVAFAAQVPMVLLTLVGGSLADRLDRRRMLLVTQAVMASTAVALAVLAATGAIRIWHILVIAVINGTANGITIPTFQAMVGDLVPREARGNAIALNSAQFHLSRSIGPALAAGLFALVQDRPGDYGGSALCFAANALSFGAVIGALLLLRHRPASVGHLEADWRAEARRFQAGLLEALGYLRAHPGIELLIHLTAITAFFGMPLVALLPAYAKDVVVPVHPLSAPAQIQGHLMTASGIGAVIGAVGITSALRKRRPIPVTLLFALLYGVTVGATGLVAH